MRICSTFKQINRQQLHNFCCCLPKLTFEFRTMNIIEHHTRMDPHVISETRNQDLRVRSCSSTCTLLMLLSEEICSILGQGSLINLTYDRWRYSRTLTLLLDKLFERTPHVISVIFRSLQFSHLSPNLHCILVCRK